MHACLNVDEIVRLIAHELVASEAKGSAVALARCYKGFEDPVLDALWETKNGLAPLLASLPSDVWSLPNAPTVSAPTTYIFSPLNYLVWKSFKRSPHTSCSWNPSYPSLLPFTQPTNLLIASSCDDGCSSTVDNNIVVGLARVMPKLKNLELGDVPCRGIPTGVTAEGLVALAHHCPDLSTLRIHFQVDSLSDLPMIDGVTPNTRSITPQRGCAVRNLEVGRIPLLNRSVATVAVTLTLVFPCIESIKGVNVNWFEVARAISYSRKIVNSSSE